MHKFTKVGLYCSCGAAWRGTIDERAIEKITKVFWDSHIGNGHGQCDFEVAAKIHAKQQQEEAHERE